MIITVASGKGGTGKTLVASNLFRILSKKKESVALIDCDVEEPNVMNFISHRLQMEIEVKEYRPAINTDQCVFCGKCVDYMIVDFPPGTGDAQITIVQKFQIDGALVVTTPQILSLNDARRGTEMLVNNQINVPLIGVVENMSWFTPLEHPDEKYYIFGEKGGMALAEEFSVPLLCQIPLIQGIGRQAEKGDSFDSLDNLQVKDIFSSLSESVVSFLK